MAAFVEAAVLQYDFQRGDTDSEFFSQFQYAGVGAAPFGTNSWTYATNSSGARATITGHTGAHSNTNMTGALNDGVELMNDYVYVRDDTMNLNIQSIGSAGDPFTLYLYSNGDQERQGAVITPLGDASYDQGELISDATGAPAATDLTEGMHYVIYTGTLGASGELSFDLTRYRGPADDNGNRWAALNGFQLQYVPEPTSLALFGLGALGLYCIRRRA